MVELKMFDKKSQERLEEVEGELVLLAQAVLQRVDVIITCGHRGEIEQNEAFKNKKSKLKYPQSKHNSLPSKAIDFAVKVDGMVVWDKKYYDILGKIAKEEATKLGISIVWGGDFRGFYDGPHVELK